MIPEDDPLFDPEDDREMYSGADEVCLPNVLAAIWPESIDLED